MKDDYCLYKNDQDLKQDFEECMREYKDYYNLAFGSREMMESHTEDTNPVEEKEETEQQEPDIEMVVYESKIICDHLNVYQRCLFTGNEIYLQLKLQNRKAKGYRIN